MYDTDAAGILYFAQQFRFSNNAFESMLSSCGLTYHTMFKSAGVGLVVVHVNASYFHPSTVGDVVTTHAWVSKIGTTSITLNYELYRESVLIGVVQSVHVSIQTSTGQKTPLPGPILEFAQRFFWTQS
jgi:1,4-dihydroxy-2-naphthoyl-CoA hydrolase